MEPLDPGQQRYLADLQAMRAAAEATPLRRVVRNAGFAGLGYFAIGAFFALCTDTPWLLLAGGAFAVVVFILTLTLGRHWPISPERLARQMPSQAAMRRGESAFQRDGVRIRPRDEKPPRSYWDIGE